MTVHARNRILVEPDWMRTLPSHSRLNVTEVLGIFGYSPHSLANIGAFIDRGAIPEPTHRMRIRCNACKLYWEVAFMRRYMCLHNKSVRDRADARLRLERMYDNKTVPRNSNKTTTYPASFDRELYGE